MEYFDRRRLKLRKLEERNSKIDISCIVSPDSEAPKISQEKLSEIAQVADSIKNSRKNNAPVIFAFGAHLIRNGMSKVLIEMISQDYVQHLLGNGAVSIHDWELAYNGKTTEDVELYLKQGQFGLWEETGLYMNKAIIEGAKEERGYGESIGKMIHDEKIGNKKLEHKFKDISVLAKAYESEIPFSITLGIGHDIIHCHPACDGAALGKTSYKDFLMLAKTFENLDNGTFVSIGSAVNSPMVFEKAFSMARNLSIQEKRSMENYKIFVNDIQPSDLSWKKTRPCKENPAYYLRFFKTFTRAGNSSYIELDNRDFLHNLYKILNS